MTKKIKKKVTKNTALFPSLASTKTLTKPRSLRSKTDTLAYYNCLLEQVANPVNDKLKITAMCHNCKHNKGKVVAAQTEHKQQLLKKVAQSYLTFGENLGHLIHEDVVGCAKE